MNPKLYFYTVIHGHTILFSLTGQLNSSFSFSDFHWTIFTLSRHSLTFSLCLTLPSFPSHSLTISSLSSLCLFPFTPPPPPSSLSPPPTTYSSTTYSFLLLPPLPCFLFPLFFHFFLQLHPPCLFGVPRCACNPLVHLHLQSHLLPIPPSSLHLFSHHHLLLPHSSFPFILFTPPFSRSPSLTPQVEFPSPPFFVNISVFLPPFLLSLTLSLSLTNSTCAATALIFSCR